MKMRFLSALVLVSLSSTAGAENLLEIYRQAQEKDPQLLQSKAVRDAAFEKINESDAANLPQINLAALAQRIQVAPIGLRQMFKSASRGRDERHDITHKSS